MLVTYIAAYKIRMSISNLFIVSFSNASEHNVSNHNNFISINIVPDFNHFESVDNTIPI